MTEPRGRGGHTEPVVSVPQRLGHGRPLATVVFYLNDDSLQRHTLYVNGGGLQRQPLYVK
jgi:hypothetical protein